MAAIGRNQLCPCGSGSKFKRCHGAMDSQPGASPLQSSFVIPHHVLDAVKNRERAYQRSREEHGEGKSVISTEVNGTRFVAAGRTLHYSPTWRTFHDFLRGYLAAKLGKEWGERQVALPVDEQHPIVQWHTYIATEQEAKRPGEGGTFTSTSGAANAWLRLAHDLYLIEHNSDLQRKLIRRLRDPVSFQGARFEAAVAAMMLASGYDLAFSDERGPGKHPEFVATHRENGHAFAVEAKSRQRAGILGFESGAQAVAPGSCGIDRLLLSAAEKDTTEPLLVFVELNTATYGDDLLAKSMWNELQRSCLLVQNRSWPSGFPCVGAIFYNDVAPWFLRSPLRDGGANIWLNALWPDTSRHAQDFRPHIQRIVRGCLQRSNPPMAFPAPV